MADITRRQFLCASSASLFASSSGLPAWAEGNPALTRVHLPWVVDEDEALAWHRLKDEKGPTLTGSASWHDFLEFLGSRLSEYGCVDVHRSSWDYDRLETSVWPDDSGWGLVSNGRRMTVSNFGANCVLTDLFDLTGRVAIVTGGSRGLGLQMASALGEFGASLALVARRQSDLDAAVAQLAAAGHTVVGFATDLGTPDAAAGLVERVIGHFGRIDILVNNAGTTWGAPAEDHPLEGWTKVINLNVTGLFLLTQAVARRAFLKQGKGAVINVASIEGLLGHHPDRPGTVAYNTAKGAVINMTRALAAEWGPCNIRVNALAPGYFPSQMTMATIERHGDEILHQTPLGKLGGETDLMGATLLLASDAGGHITGQTLVIDGGATII